MTQTQLDQQELQLEERLEMLKLEQKERQANLDREQRREKEQLEAQAAVQAQEQSAVIKGMEIGAKAATDSDRADIERIKENKPSGK